MGDFDLSILHTYPWYLQKVALKKQRRRQLRKRHLKSELALLQTLLRVRIQTRVGIFFSFGKDCIKVQEKKKKVVVLCSRPRQNVKLGTFTLQSCSYGKEMYKKA